MTIDQFHKLLNQISNMKGSMQSLELISADIEYPKNLCRTLSSFSNQDNGGIIVFGIDTAGDNTECGVYDADDLQKKLNIQCLQMEPVVCPLITVLKKNQKQFVAAEIPGIDVIKRPCYYKQLGRTAGSYTRVGGFNDLMSACQIYNYEAYRNGYQDDIRIIQKADLSSLDRSRMTEYIRILQTTNTHLAGLQDHDIYELVNLTRNGGITLSALLLFGLSPQTYLPQLRIDAAVMPGKELEDAEITHITGSIPEMLEHTLAFVASNMKTRIITYPNHRGHEERTEYPTTVIKEAILNAILHRDYSVHTQELPIQLLMFEDRLEIHNPGGIYGKVKMDQLGKIPPTDIRNPILASALKMLAIIKNSHSGISMMRHELAEYSMHMPVFSDSNGQFTVTIYKAYHRTVNMAQGLPTAIHDLLAFCKTPRTRQELCDYLGVAYSTHAIQMYITPLVEHGLLRLSIPDNPRSQKQMYYA